MNGVEILNQYEKITALTGVLLVISFSVGFVALMFFIGYSITGDKVPTILSAIITIAMIAMLTLTLLFGKTITLYEVTISDDVSMTEFHEKYNVEDVRGKIYTVTEKEDK